MQHCWQWQNAPPTPAVLPSALQLHGGQERAERSGKLVSLATKSARLTDLGTRRALWPSALRAGWSLLHMEGMRRGNTVLWGVGGAPSFTCAGRKHQTQEIQGVGKSLI